MTDMECGNRRSKLHTSLAVSFAIAAAIPPTIPAWMPIRCSAARPRQDLVDCPMRVFLDTEFVQARHGPIFLSAAFLSDAEQVLYSEMPLAEAQALLARHPNEFVAAQVLSQFGVWPGEPWHELPVRFADWVAELDASRVDVVYDYNLDYLFVEQLLERLEVGPSVSLYPTHVGYLADDSDGKKAADASWLTLKSIKGIGQHHALADVYALRSRFAAVHGYSTEPRSEAPWPAGIPFELLAVVTASTPTCKLAQAESPSGPTLSIDAATEGVFWNELSEGQRLACVCVANPDVRVVRARLIEPAALAKPSRR